MKGRRALLLATVLLVTAFGVALAEPVASAAIAIGGGLLAALAVAGSGASSRQPPRPAVNPDHQGLPARALLEAVSDPMLFVTDARVAIANTAARALLGDHIEGEDVRVAIRHPAAAGPIWGGEDSAAPVALSGLGTRESRWTMHVRHVGVGASAGRLVHLVDASAGHDIARMRTDFVANASHELRTPLAAIIGFAETLMEPKAGSDDGTRRRFLGVIHAEARRLERLVADLMSLSRIEAERHRLPDERVDMGALVAESLPSIVTTAGTRGQDLRSIPIDGELPAVLGDRAQLSQLLHNLLGNALTYGQPGTPVEISLDRSDGHIRLVVRDQGDGIAAEHLPRLTERFYRVDPGRSRQAGGTGLGLAICKHIVERHRGRLTIHSAQGVGTRVVVTLPIATVMKA